MDRIQLATIKGDREVVLNDDAAKLVVTCIRKHIERLGEIREMKQDLTGHERLDFSKGFILFRAPSFQKFGLTGTDPGQRFKDMGATVDKLHIIIDEAKETTKLLNRLRLGKMKNGKDLFQLKLDAFRSKSITKIVNFITSKTSFFNMDMEIVPIEHFHDCSKSLDVMVE